MKQYIQNIIPKLKQFSESLDKKELFLEKPWVFIDENKNQQKYIFKKNGDLIMSLNGRVTIGKWEYLPSAKSLLIDRIQDKILLNQAFVDPAVMVLKMDGQTEDHFFLANEMLLPELNVFEYIQKQYYQRNNILGLTLKDGKVLEIMGFEGRLFRNKVSIDGHPILDGTFDIAGSQVKYVIKDSRIDKIFEMRKYETNKGNIVVEIEVSSVEVIRKGNFAFQNDSPAPDGKYRIGFLHSIIIKNGQVIKA